jgi:hypothetical protein
MAPVTRTKWLPVVALALLASASAWYLLSPGYTLSRMKSLAEAGDDRAFASYVDFPALRADLKAELQAQLVGDPSNADDPLVGLGAALGSAMLGPIIDGMVSPDGLRVAFVLRGEGQAKTGPSPPEGVRLPESPVITRRGLSEFLVGSREAPDHGLVFRRHGFGWKLSGVDLAPRPNADPA